MRIPSLFLLLISAAPLAAQPVELPGPSRANARTGGVCDRPTVAADRDGNFVVVWATQLADGSAVAAQLFGAGGRRAGGELRVADGAAYGALPAVTAGRDSSFAVVWRGGDGTLEGRRFDHRGEPLTGVFHVTAADRPRRPAVAATAGGGLVVVWEAGEGSAVFGQRLAADGRKLGGRFRVHQRPGRHARPRVGTGDDGLVVVWQADDGSGYGVFGRRFDRRAKPLGGELQLNVHTSDDQRHPALAVAADGSFAAVWESAFRDGTPWSLFGRRVDRHGRAARREVAILPQAAGIQRHPALALAADGSALVAWEDLRSDPRGDVRALWLDRDGSRLGETIRIGAASGAQLEPALAATGPGSFAAVWTAGDAGPDAYPPPGIGVRRYGSPRLELAGRRFVAEVDWKDFELQTGRGVAVSHRRNSGHFWFFREDDLDLTLKIVDGRAQNGHFWVFYGAVSNVAFTLRITDRTTGRSKTYLGPVGRFVSAGDVEAFPSR